MTNNVTSNIFWPEVQFNFGMEGLIFIHIVTMAISIPGNMLVIFIVTHNKTLQEDAAYLLICSVSCADLLVSLVGQPLNITLLVLGSTVDARIERILYFSIWGFCGASAFGVIAITIDRFVYILYPMQYGVLLNRRRTVTLIVIQWTCAFAYGVLPIIDLQKSALPTSIASIITLVAMTTVMLIVYNRIYTNIRRLRNESDKPQITTKKRQSNATTTIMLIVLAFFVCWFPYIITNMINKAKTFNPSSPIRALYYWFLGLGCWNSALNVIIYGFKNNTLKHAAKKYLPLRKIAPTKSSMFQPSCVCKQQPKNSHERIDSVTYQELVVRV